MDKIMSKKQMNELIGCLFSKSLLTELKENKLISQYLQQKEEELINEGYSEELIMNEFHNNVVEEYAL